MRNLLLISNISIHNANALPSPYAIGFPAMTAWLGAVHALQRHLKKSYGEIKLSKTAVCCHQFNLQVKRSQGDFSFSIIGTANPLELENGKCKRPSFIEEARCHLDVSLLIECHGLNFHLKEEIEKFEKDVANILQGKMKMAGGDILSLGKISYLSLDESNKLQYKSVLRKLMPGYVLVERRDLVETSMVEKKMDALSALLDYLKVKYRIDEEVKEQTKEILWTVKREELGWIVPIAVGFQGISEIDLAKNQRDTSTPHRFAESIVTLGQFVMPYRIDELDDMLWQYHVDLEKNLYLCQNRTNTID